MNIYERHLSDLSRRTGIDIKLYDRLPDGIDPHIFKLIHANGASGWYDSTAERVCLYSRNLPTGEADIDATVAFLCIRDKGLKGLMREEFPLFCADVVNNLYHGIGLSEIDTKIIIQMASDFISEIPATNHDSWEQIAQKVCKYTGFENNPAFMCSLVNGLTAYHSNQYRIARNNCDYSSIDGYAKQRLQKPIEGAGVSLGKAGDPFLRIGYPDTEIYVKSEKVRQRLLESGMLDAEQSLAAKIHNPLAIIRNSALAKDGKDVLNIVVTDHHVKGKGFLSFAIDSHKDILAGYGENKGRIFIRSCKFMSEYALMCALGSDHGKSIQYLRPGTTRGYAVSEILSGMEGRSFSELGKKDGDGNTPVISPLSESRRLTHVANIVNDFKNPMNSRKRKEFFGKYLFEDIMERRDDIRRQISSLSDKATSDTLPARRIEDPMKMFFRKGDFSDTAIKKMSKANVYNAFDIMTYGIDRFKADFGPKTFKQAVAFLDSRNLSFLNHTVIPRIDESIARDLDFEGRQNIVNRDLNNAFSILVPSSFSKELRMPRKIDGTYFRGAECYCLIAKSYSLARWRDCNVFISRDEAESHDISVRSGAIPTYVRNDAALVPYYNLSETSLAVENASAFDEFKEHALNSSIQVDSYAKSYIVAISDCGAPTRRVKDNFRIDLIDSAFERRYRGDYALKSNESFKDWLTVRNGQKAVAPLAALKEPERPAKKAVISRKSPEKSKGKKM